MSRRGLRTWLAEAEQIDRAMYAAIAGTSTPLLDGAMRRLSRAADHSKISIASSAVLAVAGGPSGRRAAGSGLISVAATSAFVNLILKPLGRRSRPSRGDERVSQSRRVKMPTSRSFPSGHAAAAVAFASAAGRELPIASVPLHALSGLVAYSRVHTGVHYPGDVVAGALIGAIIADLTTSRSAALRGRRALEVVRGGFDRRDLARNLSRR